MAGVTPDQAQRAIADLIRRLADPREVRDAFGAAAAQEASDRGNRTSRPRQAHLVADALGYGDGRISLSTSAQAGNGTAGELIMGAEFGSDTYAQFGPRMSSGYWLFPTLREAPPVVIQAGENALDELLRSVL